MVDIGFTDEDKAEIEAINLKLKNMKQEVFDRILNKIWQDTNIEYIAWVQFTSYFNDGDPCVFYVRDYMPDVGVGKVFYSDEVAEDSWSVPGSWVDTDKEYLKAFFAFIEDVEMSDFMLSLFGDHASVQISRDAGPVVESYENHD